MCVSGVVWFQLHMYDEICIKGYCLYWTIVSLLVRCPNFNGLNATGTSKGKIRDLVYIGSYN